MHEKKMTATLTATAAVLVLALSSVAGAGVWTTAAWTDDASSGITTGGMYTHAYNFGNNATNAPATTINGVDFASAPGINPSASNFTLTGYDNAFGVDTNNVTTGGSDDIANSFIFNGVTGQLTLTGLVAGSTNTLNIYGVGFDGSGVREATFSDPTSGSIVADENEFGNDNGIRVVYDYTAGFDGTAVIDITNGAGGTFHLYGFANEATSAITGLFNTGVDGSGNPLADNANDPHWTVTPPGSGTIAGIVHDSSGGFPVGPWLGDNSDSAWIAPSGNTNGPAGSYTYETTFTFPSGFNYGEIVGRFATDNSVTDVVLNGNSLGITGAGFNAWVDFTIDSRLFVEGSNTLQFLVDNAGTDPGPTGLRVEFDTAIAGWVPAPSALPAGIALIGLMAIRRRR